MTATTRTPDTDFTMFDQPQSATYHTEHGTDEQVQIVGSDLSRTAYSFNAFLIVRPDGSRRITSETWLSLPQATARTTVSEVPGKPGRVITGGPAPWSSDSGLPDPITQKPALFPVFLGAYDDEEI